MKIWISALIPAKGADIYGGVRLQVSSSEQEAYLDLADWLDDEGVLGKNPSKSKVVDGLTAAVDNHDILLWNVVSQDIIW